VWLRSRDVASSLEHFREVLREKRLDLITTTAPSAG
jgi:hypothetical protein